LKVAELDVVTSRQRAEADLLAAEAKVKEAQLKAERRKQLFEQKLGSSEDYEAADSLYVQAQANVETATAQLEEVKTQNVALETRRQDVALAQAQLASDQVSLEDARQQLLYTKVTSPIDGVVTDRSVQIGAIISSGITNIGGGTTIMTLADLSHVFVLASVDESDIGRVQVGQPVNITVDAYPGETFIGEVRRIATKGVSVSNVVTFEVKIEVTGENRTKLKPEMTANVQIITTKKDDVLMIALTAVWRKDDQSMVTIRDGADHDVPVTLGISDGEHVEILSGLTEGQTVLTRDQMPSQWSNDQPANGQPGEKQG
jgi:RND family efflux transporter MFP subunit